MKVTNRDINIFCSSIAENSGSTLTNSAISQTVDEDVTANLGAAGTSTNGTDYDNFKYYVSAGATTGTATFDPTDDSVYEGSETAVISISSVSGGDAVEDGSQSVTITTDNESAPTTLAVSATSIVENVGSSLTLTATLSGTTDSDITAVLTSGTATEGTDYTDGAGNIDDIVISAGATTGTELYANR